MPDLLKHISVERLEDFWFSRAGAACAFFLAASAPTFALHYLGVNPWLSPAFSLALAAFIGILGIVGWYFATRIKQAPSGKITVAVAVGSEQASEQKKLNRDFIKALADAFQDDESTAEFRVIAIQPVSSPVQ
jgi:hypothetical protein